MFLSFSSVILSLFVLSLTHNCPMTLYNVFLRRARRSRIRVFLYIYVMLFSKHRKYFDDVISAGYFCRRCRRCRCWSSIVVWGALEIIFCSPSWKYLNSLSPTDCVSCCFSMICHNREFTKNDVLSVDFLCWNAMNAARLNRSSFYFFFFPSCVYAHIWVASFFTESTLTLPASTTEPCEDNQATKTKFKNKKNFI